MSDDYIEGIRARFALNTVPSDRLRRAAQAVAMQLNEQLDPRLLELYGYLALRTATETSREDVHDAWAVYQRQIDPHVSLIPFDDLAPFVQALDQPYVDAIHRAARTL